MPCSLRRMLSRLELGQSCCRHAVKRLLDASLDAMPNQIRVVADCTVPCSSIHYTKGKTLFRPALPMLSSMTLEGCDLCSLPMERIERRTSDGPSTKPRLLERGC